jgi:aspartate aminotransferase-like enzyme
VTVTHVDTSTGVCARCARSARSSANMRYHVYPRRRLRDRPEPEYLDEMGIDLLLTGSQRRSASPPALQWYGRQTRSQTREALGRSRILLRFQYWLPIMDTPPNILPPPPSIWCGRSGSGGYYQRRGIEARYARHRKNALAMQSRWNPWLYHSAQKTCRAVTLPT